LYLAIPDRKVIVGTWCEMDLTDSGYEQVSEHGFDKTLPNSWLYVKD
jgi:hypothetical protein